MQNLSIEYIIKIIKIIARGVKVSIKIGSFNMYKFSNETNKEISKDITKIVQIIKKFDIIALQEVYNENAITNIKKQLGSGWDYRWAAPVSKSVQAAEGYAFIWNNTKFKLATGLKKEEEILNFDTLPLQAKKEYDARIESNYRLDKMLYQGRLVRDPMYIRLESLQSWFEIRLINTHIMFSDTSNELNVSVSDSLKRKREFKILTDIYRELADKQYRNGRPAYTFLLGDYNLNLPSSQAKSPYVEEIMQHKERNGRVRNIITIQNQLTTLKMNFDALEDETYFANNYDHFTYDDRLNKAKIQVFSFNTVAKYCNDKPEIHRKEISDHIPICLELNLNKRGTKNENI